MRITRFLRVVKNLVVLLLVAAGLRYGCDAIKKSKSSSASDVPVIEVGMFEGGFGIEWNLKVARSYERMKQQEGHPVKINLWGSPRAGEKLRPRIMKNSPPEILHSFLPHWKLIISKKYYPVESLLDSPAYGQPDKTWRETFAKGALDTYAYKNKVYGVPLALGMDLFWYDKKLFREHGWEVPKTWSELEQLCEKIKEAGIAPIAFQGKYSAYAWCTLETILQRWGGMEAIERLHNVGIEKGFFVSDDFIKAAGIYQDLARKYFQQGSMSMTHTEAQLEWCNRNAAMITCGLWLENEMRANIPNDFEMSCFNIPSIEGGIGDPRIACTAFYPTYFVCTDSTNKDIAIDFLKYMTSLENSKAFSSSVGIISSVKGATDRDKISPALLSALEIMENSIGSFDERLEGLYPHWYNTALTAGLDNLLNSEWTPEQFGRYLEDEMQEIRDDEDIYKPARVHYQREAE